MLVTLACSVLCCLMAIESECLKVCFCGVSVIIGASSAGWVRIRRRKASLAQFSVSKGGFGCLISVLVNDESF